jgi:hypothetical protein
VLVATFAFDLRNAKAKVQASFPRTHNQPLLLATAAPAGASYAAAAPADLVSFCLC